MHGNGRDDAALEMENGASRVLAVTDGEAKNLSITAIVLTYNEEIHIDRCLSNLTEIAERIVVVDSNSTDATIERARYHGADIYRREFRNQADQFKWALEAVSVDTDWVLRLDADEYFEPPLIDELRERLGSLSPRTTGVVLRRKLIFRDKWIRHGGYYPTELLRLWRRGKAEVLQSWMDEHVVVTEGDLVTFEHDFCDHNLRDITWWTEKHNRYATRKMADLVAREVSLEESGAHALHAAPVRCRTERRRFLQDVAYPRTPLYLRAVLYFLYRFVGRLGFMDGKQGFLWHALQGFWYPLLIDIKIEDARRLIAEKGIAAFKEDMLRRHGIVL